MSTEVRLLLDVPFHRVPTAHGERTLVVDLWLPQGAARPLPTIVYIHGGGWAMGTQYRPPFQPRFIDQQIAVAAITYRLSGEAAFPAMLHDCKAAVRWLRAHAGAYGLDPRRIGAWGISAGGHLALLLGLTGHLPELEGGGPHPEQSSAVQAVCAWCAPTDLERVADDRFPGRDLALFTAQLLGGPIGERRELARAASPITYARRAILPTLLVHGSDDDVVPAYHSESLYQALCAAGAPAELCLVPGAGHTLDGPPAAARVDEFFNARLRPAG